MSQQKVYFAICVASALVCLVAGQSMKPMECGQKAQQMFNDYAQQCASTTRELTQNLAKLGGSSFDVNQISQESDKIMQQWQQMLNNNGEFNAQNMIQMNSQLISSQMSLASKLFNMRLGPQVYGMYTSYAIKMMQANTEFISSVSSACLPSN